MRTALLLLALLATSIHMDVGIVDAFRASSPSPWRENGSHCRRSIATTTALCSCESPNSGRDDGSSSRRSFLASATGGCLAGGTFMAGPASAGVDVSGLRVEGGGMAGNPSIANQLKAYDGSGQARVKEIRSALGEPRTATPPPPPSAGGEAPAAALSVGGRSPAATWAYRSNPGMGASVSRAGAFGNLNRYSDSLAAPASSKRRAIGVQFEFPADWLQLDRQSGGIQYVDQRNGDKLYVLRAPLPDDVPDLATVPKAWIGDAIFSQDGSFARSGQTVEAFAVSRAQLLSDCPRGMCAPHRRFVLKFSTVTGNGLVVERRGLVDAYQVDQDVYMLMTSSNAVKFEQKESRERETVENIASSFQIDV